MCRGGGDLYIAIVSLTRDEASPLPSADPEHWALYLPRPEKGEPGADGVDGVDGIIPVTNVTQFGEQSYRSSDGLPEEVKLGSKVLVCSGDEGLVGAILHVTTINPDRSIAGNKVGSLKGAKGDKGDTGKSIVYERIYMEITNGNGFFADRNSPDGQTASIIIAMKALTSSAIFWFNGFWDKNVETQIMSGVRVDSSTGTGSLACLICSRSGPTHYKFNVCTAEGITIGVESFDGSVFYLIRE